MTRIMQKELRGLVDSRHKLLAVHSTDEDVELAVVRSVAQDLDRNLHDWTLTTGIRVFAPDTAEPASVSGTEKPELALRYLLRQRRPLIGCCRGLASFTGQPMIRRLLRDFAGTDEAKRVTLLLMDDDMLHPQVQRMTVPWRPGLPGKEELTNIVHHAYQQMKPAHEGELSDVTIEQLIQNLRGLTRTEATRVVESIILTEDDVRTDLHRVIDAKRRLLESTGGLEATTIDFDIHEVGGLRGLKKWLRQRRGAFTARATAFGIDPPRGVLMLGVPGCGKSLCAKAVAADWGMPLLRLDPGVLYQKFVGESEHQLRQAIRQAEAMAPVVLWIDEIEKAFASASASSADGGLSQRMFGTLLSWMQDHRSPIFIVATANDISSLPPELMRKGRFDEVFFIDLPGVDARRQIFSIHLSRKGRNPAQFRTGELADASKDLTGAEIQQSIASGLFHAFAEERELQTEDILRAITDTQPLASLMHEKIEDLRNWAAVRCVNADG